MIRRFHMGLGLLVAALYVYVLLHQATLLPGLGAPSPLEHFSFAFSKSATGDLVAYALPLAAIACFIWPQRLMWWFSPRTPPSYDYLMTEGVWYLLGYVLLVIGVGVLMLFQ
jgi:hypothetical protein